MEGTAASVMKLIQARVLMRTINGFFIGGPVLKLDKAGGGGASQLRVLVASSRKASIAATRRFYTRPETVNDLRQIRWSTWLVPTLRCVRRSDRERQALSQ